MEENSVSHYVKRTTVHAEPDQWAVDARVVKACCNRSFCNINFKTTEIQTLEATMMKRQQAGRFFIIIIII